MHPISSLDCPAEPGHYRGSRCRFETELISIMPSVTRPIHVNKERDIAAELERDLLQCVFIEMQIAEQIYADQHSGGIT